MEKRLFRLDRWMFVFLVLVLVLLLLRILYIGFFVHHDVFGFSIFGYSGKKNEQED